MNRSCSEFQLSLFLVALLFTGFASSPTFAHSDSAYANQYLYILVPTPWFDNYFEERLDWMAELENGLTLSELSLPLRRIFCGCK